ncbi:MAG: hypothetical protein NZL90_00220 [Aquificaceae bacterium]|nr:hypothetical protein [Aquificaceae bacterium]MDW8236824.1 hypothetical protein [Aquificaceae bacterium]
MAKEDLCSLSSSNGDKIWGMPKPALVEGLFLPTEETDCTLRPISNRAFLTASEEVNEVQTPSGFKRLAIKLRMSFVQSSGFLSGENPW